MLHANAFGLSRFHEILKTLTESDEGKLHILKVVYDVWRNHPQVNRDYRQLWGPLAACTCDACWLLGR